jgi:7-cyano-7-deazaguanine tRNA-ribosyltransferase
MTKNERELFLAEHNLYVSIAEIKRIKQAIRDGRLWEHVEIRAHAHPELFTALKTLKKYKDFIEEYSPTMKKSGIFFSDSIGLVRPEVVRFRSRLVQCYSPPADALILLLSPQTRKKPFHKAHEISKIRHGLQHLDKNLSDKVHICFYAAPFGVIPMELDEVYPLSQHEVSLPLDQETRDYVADQVTDYIKRTQYAIVVLLDDKSQWINSVKESCRKTCRKKGVIFKCMDIETKRSKNILTRLESFLKKQASEKP